MQKWLISIFFLSFSVCSFSQIQPYDSNQLGGGMGDSNNRNERDSIGHGHHKDEEPDSIKIKIYSWVLENEYANIVPAEVDTFTINFHVYDPIFKNSISNTNLGSVGSAYQSNIFFDREANGDFYFLRNFQLYNRKIEDVKFYNTTKPFSYLKYVQNRKSQTMVDQWFTAFFTQNVDPHTNIGFEFDVLKNQGPYSYLESHHKFVSLWLSHNTDRYDGYISGIKSYNRFVDNGGLADSLVNTIMEPFELLTNIVDGIENNTNGVSFMTSHEYKLGHYIENIDTILGINEETFVAKGAVQYTVDFKKYTLATIASQTGTSYYENHFNNSSETSDTTIYRRFTHSLQLKAFENENRKFTFSKRAFIENEIVQVIHPFGYRKQMYSNVYVGGELQQTKTDFWKWSAYGRFALLGRNLGDALLKGKMYKPFIIGKDTTSISIEGWYQDFSADVFQENLLTNYYMWENDFNKQHEVIIKGKIDVPRLKITAGANYGLISNYLYCNTSGVPDQYNNEFSVFSIWANKQFNWWRFGWDTKVVWQELSNDAVLRLPSINAYSSIYYTHYLFKVMKIHLGAEVYYNSRFKADAYNPAISSFFLQDDVERGGYPLINLFADLKLKRTSAFVRYYHANSGFMGGDFFSSARHPLMQTLVHFGFIWTFYD